MGKRTTIGTVTLIVFAPFYVWFFPSLFLGRLPRLEVTGAIFWIYLFIGIFVVKSILEKLSKHNIELMDERPNLRWVVLLSIFGLAAVVVGVYDVFK
jgi:hypothetical protein